MSAIIRSAAFILCIVLSQGSLAGAPTDRDIANGELGMQLDDHMRQLEKSGFSGVLLVSKAGEVVIAKGYGFSDRAKAIPFTSRTAFDVGSITKQFTGAAIAKLAMQGKLSADKKISQYFADVPADKAEITLFQLLTHSAGFASDFGGDYLSTSREQIISRALASKLLFAPGTGHKYSNAGFSLLAAIIEQVSGQSYEAYLREQLWLPAGMQHTGYRLPKWDVDQVAHGYRGDKDWGTPIDKNWAEDGPYWNLRGNGGVLSTVWDLYRWHLALSGEEILSKDAKEKVHSRIVKEGPNVNSWYSYGWVLTDTRHGKLVTHNGGNGVFFADFYRYVDENIVIIAASNRSEDRSGGYVPGILRIVFPSK